MTLSHPQVNESIGTIGETPEWIRAHEELSLLAKKRAAMDAVEGRSLLRALRAGTHLHLGFGGFSEYVEALFGYKPRSTEEKLRVAEALETLPESHRALAEGSVSWSALRELTRVMTTETERDWLAVARGRSIREIERLVCGRAPGDDPSAPARRELERHVLRFEVTGETLAAFRDALAKLARDAGSRLDDDAALLLMARNVLGGPADNGRSSYQIAVTVCDECGRGFQQGRGELTEVRSDVIEMVRCDAQHIGSLHSHDGGHAQVGANGYEYEREAASAHVGAPSRAKQDVPPAVRRFVVRRDKGRCVFPGCKNRTFLDVHHLELRSEGGDHRPENLIVVCGAHHRALHHGRIIVEGRPASGLRFKRADGARYGHLDCPRAADAHGKAFIALRGLGFRESEARRALERVRSESTQLRGNVADDSTRSDTERVLREALAILTCDRAA